MQTMTQEATMPECRKTGSGETLKERVPGQASVTRVTVPEVCHNPEG